MRIMVTLANVSLLAAALSLSTASADTKPPASPAPAKSPAAAKPVTHSVSGTLESYDSAAKTVTVKGTKATWTFSATEARVWDGSKSVGLDDLSGHAGAKVSVKYTDDAGEKQASSIRLSASHTAKPSPKSK
jgi:phage baseplate assembly protein gpV